MKRAGAILLVLGLWGSVSLLSAQGTLADYERARSFLPGNLRHSIYVADVSAHWVDKTNRFWYHKVSPGGSEFIIVDGEPHMLEMNTIPGLTTESLIPQQARAAGISLEDLFTNAIELAL